MRLKRIFGDIPTCRAHLPLNLGLSINETYQYQKKNNFNVEKMNVKRFFYWKLNSFYWFYEFKFT